jgi:hypothetical protein
LTSHAVAFEQHHLKQFNHYISMSARTLSIIFISCGIIISLWYGFSGHFFIIGKLDVEKALKFSPFIGGVVGPLFALSGTLLVYENFRNQQRQMVGNNFFQLLGFHIKIIESIDTQIYGFFRRS